jgi:hypothetical protein
MQPLATLFALNIAVANQLWISVGQVFHVGTRVTRPWRKRRQVSSDKSLRIVLWDTNPGSQFYSG